MIDQGSTLLSDELKMVTYVSRMLPRAGSRSAGSQRGHSDRNRPGTSVVPGMGTIIQDWALAEQGQREAGIARIRQGLAAAQAARAGVFRPQHLTLLIEAYDTVGESAAGLAALAEALAQVEKTGDRYWEAKICRLKGALLLTAEAAGLSLSVIKGMQEAESPEEGLLKAIAIARRQEGKLLELRTTVSLARLWQQQGKQNQARRMLADIYSWFTEGFDTLDLQQAQTLF
jgi:predicted ATPase